MGSRTGRTLLSLLAALLGLAVVVVVLGHWALAWKAGDVAAQGHGAALILGVLLLIAGLLGDRFPRAYTSTGTIILNLLVVLTVLELASALIMWRGARTQAANANAVYRVAPAIPYYRDRPWGAPFWREFAAANQQYYAPYVVFRRHPFKGQYVNIGADRRRVTPGADCRAGAFTVYMLGGSTMFGTGAPDSLTIPAYMQRGLAARMPGRPVCVVNFGESAWVSTQELVQLVLALRDAHPDAVIFYDGVNDVFSAYQTGRTGSHQNEASITERFAPPSLPRELLKSTATYAMLRSKLAARPATAMQIPVPALADSIVRAYLGAVDVARSLGKADGFRTLFFWQPELTESGKTMTPLETGYAKGVAPRLAALYHDVYARMDSIARDPGDDLYDIANVLSSERGQLFIDYMHVFPDGNARVVDAMLKAWDATAAVPNATPGAPNR